MLKTEKSVNISGRSIVEHDGMEEVVVYMNANISANGGYPSISTSIQNRELYLANKAQCKADIDAFEELVDTFIEE